MILTGYFDESSTHDTSPSTGMSGIMGHAKQWSRFQGQLDKMKLIYGFTVFHAKEFKAARGELAGWPDDKYRALLVDLGQASAGVMAAVNCSLPNLEYEWDYRGGKKPKKLHLDSAYGLCFRHAWRRDALMALHNVSGERRAPFG